MKKILFLSTFSMFLFLVGCDKAPVVKCTDSPNSLQLSGQTTAKFECPANCSGGSLWGSDLYTTDSSICRAAIHAGVIDVAKGGKVTISLEAGKPSYESTSRNGIQSSSWGSYGSSYTVK
jgi:hypothetical protein